MCLTLRLGIFSQETFVENKQDGVSRKYIPPARWAPNSFFFYLHVQQSWQNCLILNGVLFLRMMSTESANSFTLIGDASDGGTMENLSRRLKVILLLSESKDI